MSGILAQLGITESTPDPSAFLNQKEVGSQLDTVKGDVRSTLDTVNTAIDAAKLVGLPESALSPLLSVKTQATDLLSANLSPAAMEAKRKALDDSLGKAKEKQDEIVRTQQATQVKDAADAIMKRVSEIKADATTSAPLIEKFQNLERRIKEASQKVIDAAQKGVAPVLDGLIGGVAALEELEGLNIEKENEENKTFDPKRALKRVMKQVKKWMYILMIVCSALLGGIILSNVYAEEHFWGTKLFYFVYGAGFFPLSLLWGIARPPTWYATLFPGSMRPAAEATSMSERLFTYYGYTAADLESEPIASTVSSGKATLRNLSIASTVVLIVTVGWPMVSEEVKRLAQKYM